MRLIRQKYRRGVKVFLDQEHVKTVPARYDKIVKPKHILNPRRKRLTNEERFLLEVTIYELELKSGNRQSRVFYDAIKRSSPDHVRLVYPKDQPHYYELTYKTGISIKCPKRIYDVGHNITPPIYRNY